MKRRVPSSHPSGSASATLSAYREKGLAGRVGFGKRPAIVVVDFILGFTDERSPLAGPLDAEVAATLKLLTAARRGRIPVYFTTTAFDETYAECGVFTLKVPSLKLLRDGSRWVRLDPRLRRRKTEVLIRKSYASAFFGTTLSSMLASLSVDTLVVTGCTTSGCVRATVVDGLQHGLKVIVPRECVGDRSAAQHEANLVDIDGKYGDVMSMKDVLAAMNGTFDANV